MARAPYGVLLQSFGLVVEFRTDDPELLERAPEVLSGWHVRPADAGPASVRFSALRDGTLTMNETTIARVVPRAAVTLDVLEVTLRHHLALHAPDHVFIHSGVVAVDGVGIVLPGNSFSGKTTLVARMVAQGATYYSDEYAVVDAAGMIHPYPRPLRLRPESGIRTAMTSVPIARHQIGRDPVRAGLIVATHHQIGAEWRPERSTPGDGAIALMGHTVSARSDPRRSLAAARAVAQGTVMLSGPRGEAAAAAAALLTTARQHGQNAR